MSITPLPSLDRYASTFRDDVDAFFATALPAFSVQAEAARQQVEAAQAATTAAAASATNAAVSASASAANAAAAAGFRGAWSALTGALARPASVSHAGVVWLLLNDLEDVTASQPGVSADWLLYQPAARAPISISSNTAAAAFGVYVFTASCTLTLPASPPPGVTVGFVNQSGALSCVINPGAEKIRGASGAMTLDDPLASAILTYSGSTKGWV